MKNLFLLLLIVVSSFSYAQPGIIFTIAGNGTAGFSGDGGAATSAMMDQPDGLVADASGNVYVADYNNNRIRKISSTGTITTVAGNGTLGFSGDGGDATAAQLNTPTSVALDAAGNLYIADGNNNCIRKVSTSGTISTVAGTGGVFGFSGDGGPATAAEMDGTYGVAVDGAGNIYIGDYNNQHIRKVDVSGNISSIAGTGVAGFSGDGMPATMAQINDPYALATDIAGNVYFTDRLNERIRKISITGVISTVAGNGTSGLTGDGAAATLASLNDPVSVHVDDAGNIYISDRNNNVIRKVNTLGIISTYAGIVSFGFSGDGGYAAFAQLDHPSGVAGDTYGNVYLSDDNNQRIRKITPSVTITGSASLCAGATITLNDSTSGGTWSSGSPSVATVGSASGTVTGVAPGTVVISYTVGSVTAAKTITVSLQPAAITGIDSVCVGHTRTLTDATTGGTWISASTAIATVGSSTGIVTGVTAGATTISYSMPTGCRVTSTFTVTPLPCSPDGISETEHAADAEIFPNPATGTLFIKTSSLQYSAFTICNGVGQTVAYGSLTHPQTTQDISSLPAGLYVIRLSGVDGYKLVKLIKE